VGVGVDGELEGEVDGEEEVERIHDLAHLRGSGDNAHR
jgi:hypothetical protein